MPDCDLVLRRRYVCHRVQHRQVFVSVSTYHYVCRLYLIRTDSFLCLRIYTKLLPALHHVVELKKFQHAVVFCCCFFF